MANKLREMPVDFEETYRTVKNMSELRRKYVAGDATIERWIDEINIRRAENRRKMKSERKFSWGREPDLT